MTVRAAKLTTRVGDMRALMRASRGLHVYSTESLQSPIAPEEKSATGADGGETETEKRNGDAVQRKRRIIAMFCKMVGEQVVREGDLPPRPPAEPLSPRQRQTLELLLAGHAEKQIAARLQISRHTVHVYVKSLYKCFGVCSRAELLARWVQR
jgi:DNA-binding NarL/FixJ family response regulator